MTYRTFETGKMADKFCSACGQKYEPKDTVKFCFQCGSSLAGLSSLPSTSVLTSNTTMSLESFKHRKETARSSLFSLRTRCSSKKAKRSETVTIRIGLFRYEPDRNVLKPQYGKNLNVTVKKSSTYAEILEQALVKRRAHDRHFCAEAQDNNYPDGSEAIFLPGKPGKFFSLQEYKDDLGSPFSAIKLFLCSVNDVNSFENGERSSTYPPTSFSEDKDVVKDAENNVHCDPSFEEIFHEDFLSNPPWLSSSQLSPEQ